MSGPCCAGQASAFQLLASRLSGDDARQFEEQARDAIAMHSGQAADLLCPGYGPPTDVCRAIAGFPIGFDQLILEFGCWAHIAWAHGTAPDHRPERHPARVGLTASAGNSSLSGIKNEMPYTSGRRQSGQFPAQPPDKCFCRTASLSRRMASRSNRCALCTWDTLAN